MWESWSDHIDSNRSICLTTQNWVINVLSWERLLIIINLFLYFPYISLTETQTVMMASQAYLSSPTPHWWWSLWCLPLLVWVSDPTEIVLSCQVVLSYYIYLKEHVDALIAYTTLKLNNKYRGMFLCLNNMFKQYPIQEKKLSISYHCIIFSGTFHIKYMPKGFSVTSGGSWS